MEVYIYIYTYNYSSISTEAELLVIKKKFQGRLRKSP